MYFSALMAVALKYTKFEVWQCIGQAHYRVLEYVARHIEIYCKGLTHGIQEVEKPHDLLSVNWKPRKATGAALAQAKGLRTRRANGVDPSLSLTVHEPGAPVSESRRRDGCSSSSRDRKVLPSLPVGSIEGLTRMHDAHPH